jgi:acetate kinase
MRILVLNSGSSSLKADLYEFEPEHSEQLPAPEPLSQQNLEWTSSTESLLGQIVHRAGHVDAVGHRIVHGGARYHEPTLITPEVRQALAECAEIAPVHTGRELEVLDAAVSALGAGTPQIAVFDTAFHATLDPAAYTYGVPYDWFLKDGIRRYGFHGLSYQYASRRAAQLAGADKVSRLLACHLGSGASLCAIKDGKSVDTTMGFTPLEGLVMATRSGTIDPGILIYLQRHKSYSDDDMERVLNRDSGLTGLSGASGDMRKILAARQQGDARAALAFDVYLHSLVRHAGMMAAVLGGLDALVFTGGVGENSAPVREALCQRLAYLGVAIDPTVKIEGDTAIHAASSAVRVLVIHAREEWEIARACVGQVPDLP